MGGAISGFWNGLGENNIVFCLKVIRVLICNARYPITDSTWEDEDSMRNPQELIQHFMERASKAGVPGADDPHATILLKEAVEAGLRGPDAEPDTVDGSL